MQFLRCLRDDAKVQKRKFGFFTYMCSLPSSAREKITISVCIIDEQTLRFHLCIQRFANEECTRKMYWDFARNRGNHLKNSLIKNSLTFANHCGLEIGSIKYLDSTQVCTVIFNEMQKGLWRPLKGCCVKYSAARRPS